MKGEMNTVKVKTSELLAKLKDNREAHRGIFLKAVEGYRKQAIREIEAMLAEAKEGKRIRRAVGLVEPMDQTKDYDRVIRMLEMSVDAEVELSASEFSMYVMDDWNWKGQFSLSNSQYIPQAE